MVDKTVTDKDIEDTLRAIGIEGHALPHGTPGARTDARDLQETLRAAGIDATVTDKGVAFKDEGFNDTAEERAAMRLRRGVQRTTPAKGPGFEEQPKRIVPTEKERALANAQGYSAPFVSGIPVAGPLLERAGAAGAAAINREPPGSSFSERYGGELITQRNATKFFEQENPGGSLVAGLGGGIAGTLPLMATKLGGMAMGTYGPSTGSRVLTGTFGGAGINALDAALRGDNVVHGAMLGGAGGLLGPLVGEMARGGTNFVSNNLLPRTGALRDMHPGSINKLTAALEGETPGSLTAGRAQMGPHGFLGDINTGLTDIAGGLANTPGQHKAVVKEAYRVRDAGARDRIEQAATGAAGPPVNTVQFEKMTTEARKKAADPLYAQWRDTVVHPTDEIKELIPRLEKAGAFKMAEELAGVTGDKINMNFFTTGAKKDFPTAQTWDYVKRGLDRRIDAAYSGANPDRTLGGALVKLKNDMLKEIENAPGGAVYKQARKEFADHSALLDQVQAGKDTFIGGRSGLTADELREELRGLSRPELSARLIGMRAAIKDTMGATFNGDTQMRNKFLAPNNIEKLELLIGKDRAKALVESMHQEKFLKDQSRDIIHGSQTTPKAEQVKALQLNPLPEWNPNLTQPLSWLPPSMLDQMRPSSVIDAWRGQGNNKAMNQLAHLITMPEGPQMNDLITALAGESRRRGMVDQRAGAVGNLLGGVISGPGTTTARRRYFRKEEEPAQPSK